MKNTKIISTIGPATDSKEKITEIIEAGVNVVRLNFSHVDHEQHGKTFDRVRETSEKTAVMADTKGPEIRLGEVEEDTELKSGEQIILTVEEEVGDDERLPVQYTDLLKNLEAGDEVRIDDGKIELNVIEVGEDEAVCEVIFGGEVSTRKAVNVPGKDIGLRAPTKKDREDIIFAAEKGFDFISLSFVKHADDVREVREILEDHGSEAHIISKIEHRKAVENFDEILKESDGIMVARGDLGVEMPAAELPGLQKEMIRKCNRAGKPVITATQMLESMTENSTATRAEISDVANAVLDGTDAVMLSGETAIGDYPVKTVEFMSEVVKEAENTVEKQVHHTVKEKPSDTREIICKSVWQASNDGDSDYIVAHTSSGSTARNIAKHRPETDIIAFTDSERVERQLQLVWGVQPYYEEFGDNVDEMVEGSAERMKRLDLAEGDDELVLTAGIPTSVTGTTNMMQMRTIDSILGN
ncbi:pyruvate kinase [Candidatus Nanohalobium constans]|uniref:Pyruvate kinase n=1 Tax=Candidatus Nanohalobium constans TaxID=2565781 RepID=A0A5Q0UFS8_9ARCH|nr:pyruvate kinase [Candidatus Nanohalobium constans]QGA80482.1 pyruvate kinase [Candidatus Nanohalobium constans]